MTDGEFAVDLFGYGHVARALLPLLRTAAVPVATIHDSRGIRLERATRLRRRVFVDATSPRYDGTESATWVRHLERALARGTPIVTCNKAPLAIAWRRLITAAKRSGASISCSATVGGGTPILQFLRRLHDSHGIARIEAPLNATLNFVLAEVSRGTSIAAAVRRAQRAGWAEPDPTLDLDGTDARAKAIIIHNALFPERRALELRSSLPRLHLDECRIRRLAGRDGPPRAIATVEPGRIDVRILGARAARRVPGNLGVAGVRAILRDGSEATLTGPGAGPRVTAGAVLGDLLALRDAGGSVRP